MGHLSIWEVRKRIKLGKKLDADILDKSKLDEIKDFEAYVRNESYPSKPESKFLSFIFVPRFENNILALVYGGAAFLVMVLGLRGLSTKIWDIAPIICGDDHRLKVGIILVALLFEFLMIIALAITMWNKIEDNKNVFDTCPEQTNSGTNPDPLVSNKLNPVGSIEISVQKLKDDYNKIIKQIEEDKAYIDKHRKIIDDYHKSLHDLNKG